MEWYIPGFGIERGTRCLSQLIGVLDLGRGYPVKSLQCWGSR